jgi:hypothetical protein
VSDLAWLIDGNNVFGSRPDGWWNDPQAAMRRLAQRVAEWCRTHDDPVTLVFDGPVGDDTMVLAGGNLRIEVARRRGRDAADDLIVELAQAIDRPRVVTADRGLRQRLIDTCGERVEMIGVGRFRELVGY